MAKPANFDDVYQEGLVENDTSDFTHCKYFYHFPYESNSSLDRDYLVHDLSLKERVPFISILSDSQLSKEEAYLKLSVSISLYSIFEKVGFLPRPVSAIGGYHTHVEDAPYVNIRHSPEVEEIISKLSDSPNSYQIQSRFTLSRAHALMRDPESAAIEFFKVIELYIKNCAYTGVFSKNVTDHVLNQNNPKIFSTGVKKELVKKAGLDSLTVDTIFKLKNVRNRFIGHGGIRPVVADIFGDPENNKMTIANQAFQYDSTYVFGEPFYEKVMYDIEVLAVILFCKMNGITPLYLRIPGCWWQPNEVIETILQIENIEPILYGADSPLAKKDH